MSETPDGSIRAHFGQVVDPRVERTKHHQLLDIILIAICGVICGADNWVEIEQCGNDKLDWFRTFLSLPNGIPSHDTFGDVFARIDPAQFQAGFRSWVQTLAHLLPGDSIALDGKVLCGSLDTASGQKPLDMVSAWAGRAQLVLAQVKVDQKSNEMTAIPALLDLLALSGCIVTIDAMGCQREIAQAILDKDADYLLALKGNQGHLLADVTDIFTTARAVAFKEVAHDQTHTTGKEHGRMETRRCWTISDPMELGYLRDYREWPHLRSVVMLEATRQVGTHASVERRYYISSLALSATRALEIVRAHWGIENEVHWVLDVAFREDDCRVHTDFAPQNLAVIRHLALNLLKQEQTAKVGIKAKRLKAGWSTAYLRKVLAA
jgi:predicted transposase YbfD/YdcC